ncbi:hypothetical protein B0H14DRAFT_2563633 [Mycena olivaceomarginata]|nr:hypothetical protein B0H14DRAFT_2563633 [Mycena olivaceomarginata]
MPALPLSIPTMHSVSVPPRRKTLPLSFRTGQKYSHEGKLARARTPLAILESGEGIWIITCVPVGLANSLYSVRAAPPIYSSRLRSAFANRLRPAASPIQRSTAAGSRLPALPLRATNRPLRAWNVGGVIDCWEKPEHSPVLYGTQHDAGARYIPQIKLNDASRKPLQTTGTMILHIILPIAATFLCDFSVHASQILHHNLISPLRTQESQFLIRKLQRDGDQFGGTLRFHSNLFSTSELHTTDLKAINHVRRALNPAFGLLQVRLLREIFIEKRAQLPKSSESTELVVYSATKSSEYTTSKG